MLGTQNLHDGNEKDQVRVSPREEGYLFDKRILFATPKESDEFVKLCERNQQLQLCIPDFGLDLVRTAVIFGTQEPFNLQHKKILQIRRWFESVWEAVSIAHPNLDTWEDSQDNATKSLVHVLPHYPNISHSTAFSSGDEIWLAAQEALLSFTNYMDAADKVLIMKRLATLTTEIINWDQASGIEIGVHYHAARILINLIAPFAPSFAEECWVLLHYGPSPLLGIHPNVVSAEEVSAEEDVDDDSSETRSFEEIEFLEGEEEEMWKCGYTHLPRQCYPETLPSLFEIAPPIPEATEAVYLLKQRLDARKSKESDDE
ncbi:MAG: hypothetical protein Q9226_005110 [Calogaya cf. arnoldii]